jgi:sulfur-carrier protein
MKILYFASVRERVGLAEEQVDLPAGIATIGELVAFLRGRGPHYENAFAGRVLAAVDKARAPDDAPIAQAREIAFFPPMTGG